MERKWANLGWNSQAQGQLQCLWSVIFATTCFKAWDMSLGGRGWIKLPAWQEPLSSLPGNILIWIPAPESWRNFWETDPAQQWLGLLPVWACSEGRTRTSWETCPLPDCSWQQPKHFSKVHQLYPTEDRVLLQGEQTAGWADSGVSRQRGEVRRLWGEWTSGWADGRVSGLQG